MVLTPGCQYSEGTDEKNGVFTVRLDGDRIKFHQRSFRGIFCLNANYLLQDLVPERQGFGRNQGFGRFYLKLANVKNT